MPLFRIAWVTSCLSIVLAYSQSLLKLPNYFSAADAHSFEMSLASASATPLATAPVSPSAVTGLHASLTEALERSLAFKGNSSNPRTLPLDDSTCHPLTETQKSAVSVAAVAALESPSAPPPKNVSQRLGQFVQNLLGRGSKTSEPMQAERRLAVEVAVKPIPRYPADRVLEWGQPERRALSVSTAPTETQTEVNAEQELAFQVRVNNRAILQFDKQQQADSVAQRLKQSLAQPGFEAERIEPALSGENPVVMQGRTLLLTIDDSLAPKNESNRDLLAINSSNNLRAALGAAPLTLWEAQERMYRLEETSKTLEGLASWYGGFFHGRLTANGETYNKHGFTAAHPSLPFDTYLKVTNLKNNHSAIVRINDRGPFIAPRTLDLSWGVAKCIGSEKIGVIPYKAVLMKSKSSVR